MRSRAIMAIYTLENWPLVQLELVMRVFLMLGEPCSCVLCAHVKSDLFLESILMLYVYRSCLEFSCRKQSACTKCCSSAALLHYYRLQYNTHTQLREKLPVYSQGGIFFNLQHHKIASSNLCHAPVQLTCINL